MTGTCHSGATLTLTSACCMGQPRTDRFCTDAAGAAFGGDGLLYVCDYKVGICVVRPDPWPVNCVMSCSLYRGGLYRGASRPLPAARLQL